LCDYRHSERSEESRTRKKNTLKLFLTELSENIVIFVEPKLFQLFIMKKHVLTLCLLFISVIVFAGKFVLIPVTDNQNSETLFAKNDVKIHYYCDDYVLATTDNLTFEGTVVLDEHAFGDVKTYAIVYCVDDEKEEYLKQIAGSVKVLHSGKNYFIMKRIGEGFITAMKDGMVMVRNISAKLPRYSLSVPVERGIDPFIQTLIEKINKDTLMKYIKHFEDYGTRVHFKPQAYLAQDWIKTKFETWGLDVEIQEVSAEDNWWGTPPNSSGNVIAVQKGTKFPEKYIVCGAHYDSFVTHNLDNCPGADDNASGTSGVLEAARILSQYNFEYSIIYCAFAAEEVGIYGSNQYVSRCDQEKMDILGYFNLDMTGYLIPGNEIKFHVLYPSTAKTLADYFNNICTTYFPEIPVQNYPEHTLNVNSDHKYFNLYGYKGIWWFEYPNALNPKIHTTDDKIGPSLNSPEQATIFSKALVAAIATLAVLDEETPQPLFPPTNCAADNFFEMQIKIIWNEPDKITPDGYFVYRGDVKIFEKAITTTEYFDTPNSAGEYCYKVSALYGQVESEPSNTSCAWAYNDIAEFDSNFFIYPNPTIGEFTIDNGQLTIECIEIYDVYGRIVKGEGRKEKGERETVIDISHLPTGTYFLKITTNNTVETVKIVKL